MSLKLSLPLESYLSCKSHDKEEDTEESPADWKEFSQLTKH